MRKKFAPDEMFMYIEHLIITGEHPALRGRGPIAHSVYLRLCGLCWLLGREDMSGGYLHVGILAGYMDNMDQRVFLNAVDVLQDANLVVCDKPSGRPLQYGVFVVPFLAEKIKGRDWKESKGGEILANFNRSLDGHCFMSVDSQGIHSKSAIRDIGGQQLNNQENTDTARKNRIEKNRVDLREGATPKSASCPTAFPENPKTQRTRKLTDAEQAFADGFTRMYGNAPLISKRHAIRLRQLVGVYGQADVTRRIKAWWHHPGGNWVDGARTLGAFLSSFDSLADGLVYKPPEDPTPQEEPQDAQSFDVNGLVSGLAAKMGGG